jgi:predicted phosphodiesterase
LYTLGALANSNTSVHYVIGNHDYSLSNLEAFKIGDEDVLVYGHTHDPFVKKYEVNTGSWVSGEYKSNSYVIIDDGKVELKFWE